MSPLLPLINSVTNSTCPHIPEHLFLKIQAKEHNSETYIQKGLLTASSKSQTSRWDQHAVHQLGLYNYGWIVFICGSAYLLASLGVSSYCFSLFFNLLAVCGIYPRDRLWEGEVNFVNKGFNNNFHLSNFSADYIMTEFSFAPLHLIFKLFWVLLKNYPFLSDNLFFNLNRISLCSGMHLVSFSFHLQEILYHLVCCRDPFWLCSTVMDSYCLHISSVISIQYC